MTEILVRSHNGVLDVSLNRPEKRNALNQSMYQQLSDLLLEAEHNAEVNVLLLSGQKFTFTAGNDLQDFMQNPISNPEAPVLRFLKALANFPKPIVAAVNGPAIGIGTTLLLHCDLVYSGESSQFQMPFVNLGLVPEFAASYLLPLKVGHQKAAEWLMLGKSFGPNEALNAGLINAVFGDESYLNAAHQQAQLLAAQPTEAVCATKRLLKQPFVSNIHQAMDAELATFIPLLKSEHFRTAVSHFLNPDVKQGDASPKVDP